MNPFRRLIIPAILLLILLAVGVSGYYLIEGWSLLESVYMLVITLSTVGFHEVHALSDAGRIFTMFLIVSGVGTAVYAIGAFGEIIVEGQLFGYRRKMRMERKIRDMKDHYIICGFGRVGHQVAAELSAEKLHFVVIDPKQETAEEMEPKGIPYIVANASASGVLEKAGIEKAKGLFACADSDEENVFVTLSARALNTNIHIVARASNRDTEEKLKIAGANRTISPYFISGRRMAALATLPFASDFLDMVMHGEHLEFNLREIPIPERSSLISKSLAEAEIRQKSGATVLAIRKVDGGFNLQPLAMSKIEKGDILIVIGTQEQLEILEKMIS